MRTMVLFCKYQDKWIFPLLAASGISQRKSFMKDQKWIDYLKLRASWGKLGNDKIQASDGFAPVTQDMTTTGTGVQLYRDIQIWSILVG